MSTPRSLWSTTGHASSPSLSPPHNQPDLLSPASSSADKVILTVLVVQSVFYCFTDLVPWAKLWDSNHFQLILLFLFLWSKDSLTCWWVIYHCIMGLELFWVTQPIRSVIPSCLPDELWESAMCVQKANLGKQSSLWGDATMAVPLPPRGIVNDKCSFLFYVSCFPHTLVKET